jgi:hypothetical protein
MNGHARTHQPAPTPPRRPVAAAALTALAAVAIMAGGCGSPTAGTGDSASPAPTATGTAGTSGSAALEPAPEETGTAGNTGDGGDREQAAPPPEPLSIEVTTSAPTAAYPCHPSGTIVVSGGSDSGDSTRLPDSDEYPLEVTYQWFIRKADPEQNPVPVGQPGTLQFNVAGGIPVSGPELNPAPDIEVELRIVDPGTVSGGWVTHPGCG